MSHLRAVLNVSNVGQSRLQKPEFEEIKHTGVYLPFV